jgi:rfaE bifunctional protein nucleotidyltransferase chain/domain
MKIKKIIGFTNGCFDILHFGHIELLKKAKSKCDFLIVGLNSDKSIKKIKGNKRPILNLKNRIKVIKSIKYVNKVIVFDETNPLKVIKKIKPDIIFKGSDYKLKNIVGYNFQMKRNKKIEIIKLIGDISTTKILKKLLK